MKKLLVIFSLIVTAMGLFVLSAPALLRVSGLDEPIKQAIARSVFRDDKARLALDDIHIGLGEIQIDHLSVISARDGVHVTIGGFNLRYSIYKLARVWKSPIQAIDGIFLSNPKIHFTSPSSFPHQSIAEKKSFPVQKLFRNFPNIRFFGIRNGEIVYESADSGKIVLGRQINGSIARSRKDTLQIVLNGSVGELNEQNFSLTFKVNELTEDWMAAFHLRKLRLDSVYEKYLPAGIRLKSGEFSGNYRLSGNLQHVNDLQINGTLQINDGAVNMLGQPLDRINFNAVINDNCLLTRNGRIGVGTNLMSASLRIDDILHPRARLKLYSKDFYLGQFLSPGDKILKESRINLDATVDMDSAGIHFNGEINRKNFKLWGDNIGCLRARIAYQNKQLRITDFFLGDSSVAFTGKGLSDFRRGYSSLELNGNIRRSHNILLNKMRNARQTIRLFIAYQSNLKKIDGQWEYGINLPGDNFFYTGTLNGTPREITILTDKKNSPEFNFFAHISGLDHAIKIDKIAVDNPPLAQLSDDLLIQPFFQRHTLHSRLSGTPNDLHGSLFFSDVKDSGKYVFNGQILNAFRKSSRVDGTIKIDNLAGHYQSLINPHKIETNFQFDEKLNGRFMVNWDSSAAIDGDFKINNLNLYQVFNDSGRVGDYRRQGALSGRITLNGSLEKPVLKAQLTGDRFVLNDVGYYQPVIRVFADRTKIDFGEVRLNYNNTSLLDGHFTWYLLNNQIDGSFSGKDIDGRETLKALGMDSLLSGLGNYRFDIYGNAGSPQIDGSINFRNGVFNSVAFDSLKLKFTDKIRPDKSVFNTDGHQLLLHELYASRAGRYHLNAVGKVPLDQTAAMDLAVNFDGDLLRFLPRIEPFFLDGSSMTDVVLHLTGSLDKIRLASAKIKIDHGDIWLNDVAPHVSNISGVISLAEGENRVQIKNFKAFVGDGFLQINTLHDPRLLRKLNLKPWYFRGLNLNFGVLALQTGKQGVAIHLPGLMKKDITGRVRLFGKKTDESFYLAGPAGHPHAHGALALSNARVTYPFLHKKGVSSRPGAAVQFLSEINWNVGLSVGEDVIYERQIPAYIDNVQAELTVDEKLSALAFTGVINDGTFKPVGRLESTRGRLEYLDQTFKVDRFGLTFNRFSSTPEIAGKAWTTIRDSVGAVPKTIYLKLYTYDPATGQERLSGNWEDFRFKLVSADPTIGETQEQVLAYLGYSVGNLKDKATRVGGAITERFLIRPLLRPLERALEQHLGIDFVRFNSSIAKNIFYNTIGGNQNRKTANILLNPFTGNFSYLYLMSSSEVTLGKYLTQNLYVTYTGQLVSVYDKVKQSFDFNHSFGLEYKFFSNILLELEYDRERLGYLGTDTRQPYLEDFKIRLRQSFTF